MSVYAVVHAVPLGFIIALCYYLMYTLSINQKINSLYSESMSFPSLGPHTEKNLLHTSGDFFF